jgi:hypothetical protein
MDLIFLGQINKIQKAVGEFVYKGYAFPPPR